MKRFALLFFLLMAPLAVADAAELCTYLTEEVEEGTRLAQAFGYSNEDVNIYTLDGDEVGHVVLRDKVVEERDCTLIEEPTYNVYVRDALTIENIDSVDDFNYVRSAGELRIEGVTLGKKIKGGLTNAVLTVVGWFR